MDKQRLSKLIKQEIANVFNETDLISPNPVSWEIMKQKTIDNIQNLLYYLEKDEYENAIPVIDDTVLMFQQWKKKISRGKNGVGKIHNVLSETDNNTFNPSKDMWYIYFNFYTNTQDEIEKFKNDLKEKHPFILGFVDRDIYFNGKQVLVYVNSNEEVGLIKNNDDTQKIYNKYVGDGGHKVF